MPTALSQPVKNLGLNQIGHRTQMLQHPVLTTVVKKAVMSSTLAMHEIPDDTYGQRERRKMRSTEQEGLAIIFQIYLVRISTRLSATITENFMRLPSFFHILEVPHSNLDRPGY